MTSVPRSRTRVGSPALALLLALALTGCPDDGDDEQELGAICVQFIPSEGSIPSPPNVVAQPGIGSTCSEAEVELVITGPLTGVFGASFTVLFDPSVVRYSGLSTAGSVLDGPLIFQEDEDDLGEVVISLTRQGTRTVDVTEPDTLVRLFFTKATDQSAGSGLEFFPADILDAQLQPIRDISHLKWEGGQFSVHIRF